MSWYVRNNAVQNPAFTQGMNLFANGGSPLNFQPSVGKVQSGCGGVTNVADEMARVASPEPESYLAYPLSGPYLEAQFRYSLTGEKPTFHHGENILRIAGGLTALLEGGMKVPADCVNFQPINHIEENHLAINHLLSKYPWESDTLPAVKALLKEIAGECPSEGGMAVYQARALIVALDPGVEYEARCLALSEEPASAGASLALAEIEVPSLSIYPSPAREQVFIQGASGQIHIFDLNGHEMLVGDLSGSVMHVSTVDWSAGIYFVRHEPPGAPVSTYKLVIE